MKVNGKLKIVITQLLCINHNKSFEELICTYNASKRRSSPFGSGGWIEATWWQFWVRRQIEGFIGRAMVGQ